MVCLEGVCGKLGCGVDGGVVSVKSTDVKKFVICCDIFN